MFIQFTETDQQLEYGGGFEQSSGLPVYQQGSEDAAGPAAGVHYKGTAGLAFLSMLSRTQAEGITTTCS